MTEQKSLRKAKEVPKGIYGISSGGSGIKW